MGIFRQSQGDNAQSVFLMVEGIQGNTLRFRRYDVVISESNTKQPKLQWQEKTPYMLTANRVLRNELLQSDSICGVCWSIVVDDAEKLHLMALEQEANPEKIGQLLGIHTTGSSPDSLMASAKIITSSGATTFGATARKTTQDLLSDASQYCFMWAKRMLCELNISEIQRNLPQEVDDITALVQTSGSATAFSTPECNSGGRRGCVVL